MASWNVLERRYNHPFLLLEAYRQKLASWPDIKGNDGDSLQMFADFLNSPGSDIDSVRVKAPKQISLFF